jgi:hypothetical protein
MKTLGLMVLRAAGLAGLLLFVVAVGVGRMVPAGLDMRMLSGQAPVLLDREGRTDRGLRFVDPASGRVETLLLPAGDLLENASCSPWIDPEGHRQVVGRWSEFSGRPDDLVVRKLGLARYSYPDGAVLDRIETDDLPFRAPCWYPGTGARVLFAGGDGRLYRYSFENAAIGKDRPMSRPEAIAVRPGVMPLERLYLTSPTWPTDPRLGGRLLVAVTHLDELDDNLMARSSIWWIELNGAGNEVVAAGRVTETSRELAELSPSVGVAPDGTLLLAYLGQRRRTATWDLLVAPLHVDPKTGVPSARTAETVELASGLSPETPAFSPDARVLTVQRPYWLDHRAGLRRVAVPRDLAAGRLTDGAPTTGAARSDRAG